MIFLWIVLAALNTFNAAVSWINYKKAVEDDLPGVGITMLVFWLVSWILTGVSVSNIVMLVYYA